MHPTLSKRTNVQICEFSKRGDHITSKTRVEQASWYEERVCPKKEMTKQIMSQEIDKSSHICVKIAKIGPTKDDKSDLLPK